MSKIQTTDIYNTVWNACDTFRGVIDPSQYKDYILVMLFIKYISDVNKEKRKKYAEQYDGNKDRIERAMQAERFIIPEKSTFDFLYENRNEPNIGSLIDIALADLEEANRKKLTSESGSGVFRNISFNSSNLGSEKDKNARLKQLLVDFSKLDLTPSHLDKKDIIGDAYEYLIANFASDAGKKAGEFFTPSEVSLLLAMLTKGEEGSEIYDPTCGSGSLLIKAAKQIGSNNASVESFDSAQEPRSRNASVERSRNVAIYGQENNGSTWALAVMNMFLHNFDNANIRWGDTIRNPRHLANSTTLQKFDVVVANPPFSLKKWGSEEAANDPYNRFWRGLPPVSRGDWAFVSHMIESAKEGTGKVGVVVPHGVLFRGSSEGKIRQQVIEENLLEAVIGLPEKLFFGTGIPAAIMIFNKKRASGFDYAQPSENNRLLSEVEMSRIIPDTERSRITTDTERSRIIPDTERSRITTDTERSRITTDTERSRITTDTERSRSVLFIDASQHFKSGTNQNVLREEDIQKVVSTYEKFISEDLKPGVLEDKYSYVATFDEIKENDFNLNIPRYVDTFEPEPPVDMKAVADEIKDLEKELAEVQDEMRKYMEKLEF